MRKWIVKTFCNSNEQCMYFWNNIFFSEHNYFFYWKKYILIKKMYIQFISNLKFVSTFKKLKITKICIFWDSLWNFLIYICQLIDWNDYTRPQLSCWSCILANKTAVVMTFQKLWISELFSLVYIFPYQRQFCVTE